MRKQEIKFISMLLCVLLQSFLSFGQDQSSPPGINETVLKNFINSNQKKLKQTESRITKSTERALRKLEKHEARLRRKLHKIDSAASENIFSKSKEKFSEFNTLMKEKPDLQIGNSIKTYIPLLDTLQCGLKFLNQNNNWVPNIKNEKAAAIEQSLKELYQIKEKLKTTEDVKAFIKERKSYLKEQLKNYNFEKYLNKYNKEVFYYVREIKEIKESINEPEKFEKSLIRNLTKIHAFQNFMNKNSELASLFNSSNVYSNPVAIQGMQVRLDIQESLQQRFTGAGVNPDQMLNQQIQTAKSELEKLKQKAQEFGSLSSEDDMPDFKGKLNSQKTKSLKNRIEYGSNIQFTKSNNVIPTATDLALSIGYKLSDQFIIGVGLAGKLGLGRGFDNIRLTPEGYSVRSFIDWRLKGNFFVTGGYEQNRMTNINPSLFSYTINNIQQTAVLGLSRKYKVSKKITGKMSLLYDFLAKQHNPGTQSVLLRFGYNF
jgi:hypothetical protein